MNKKYYGLVGFPLGHSFSKGFFTDKFNSEGIEAEYLNFEIETVDSLPNIIKENNKLMGLNVTIPHKLNVMSLLNYIDPLAERVGAVNVVKISRDKSGNITLGGYNSDIIGFKNSISPLIKSHHKKALILGTGGVSKAIACAFEELGIEYLYVSRERKDGAISYNDLDGDIMSKYNIIVNASPIGMFPKCDAAPNIPYNLVTEKHLIYDTVYNPIETQFMIESAKQGATVKGGLEMLHLQAIAAWEIWNS